ncbi:AbrB/MazE/SpoVT family DNA-binding domain-containing protein [Streptosporangium sp. NBC_01756]|uniref:AbrB/MazE/SpoVT family DNA-binding domain-containing protein n=1 Tax=Streptosporangium sp. NBC_01756 TaxID=2975950 RepID=UPI002DDAFAF2|nr:AbrB/MazE/SpoVT family DNA-binding domain-containing protein [Streptosporangium sp. NBC_01756]WSC90143.1 AbrB/MazE/SpoVT family DNA-binding domain-containing protein [Streptosporangium sp. NBC_01756]
MRINGKGQVTIPAELRHRYGWDEGEEVEVSGDAQTIQIVRRYSREGRGKDLTQHMRGKASLRMRTDELMDLLRGE